MLEKSLHGANIATCCAALVATVDLTVTGGAASLIGAALSSISIFKSADTTTQETTKLMKPAFDMAINQSHMTTDRAKIAVQMLEAFPLTHDLLAQSNMTPATAAQKLRTYAKDNATNSSFKTEVALNDYAYLIEAIATPITAPTDQNAANQKELLKRTDQLLTLMQDSGRSDALRDEGINETTIIRLAQRIAHDTDDVGQAWLELQNAMDIAVRVQAEGRQHSNHGDFVDTVLARVAELARDGDYTSARDAIRDALAKADAEKSRLLASGVEVALLDRDTAVAANLLIQKADLDAGGTADIEALRALWQHYYEVGRDKGSNLDSTLAIDLAQRILTRATIPDERGAALNDLGTALATLGERENGTTRLNEAVTAYTKALKESPRDPGPLQWAATQNNLGSVLLALGERDSGTVRLDQALAAYTEALKEYTRDRLPLEWARTQMNLGVVLQTLGERESGTARLDQAVTAYKEALKERTRDREPLQWAATQNNLGTALLSLAKRESGTARLDQAVIAFTEALKESTRDRVPLQWAATQNNLGSALLNLAERENGTAWLDQAVVAFTKALKERTHDRVPRDSAMTQGNLGTALVTLGKRENSTTRLNQALSTITETLKEFPRDHAPLDWAMTQGNLAGVEIALFDKTSDTAHLDRATNYVMTAREVYEDAQASQYIMQANQQFAHIESRRA